MTEPSPRDVAGVVLGMKPDVRAGFVARLSDTEFADLEAALARRTDPDGRAVYRRLGYEPICIPRVKATLAAGYRNPIEAELGTAAYRRLVTPDDDSIPSRADLPPMPDLPEPCGDCPAERFDAAHEPDVLFGGAAGGSKMLRVDEPVPTPAGWSTVGDLVPGDVIFDERGRPTTVLAVHPIDLRPVSYRLTFDDGSTIEACADHLWLTFDADELAALTRRDPEWRAQRRARRPKRGTGAKPWLAERNAAKPTASLPAPTGTVRTTKEIVGTLRTVAGRSNHAMPVAGALDLPDVDLPLDPYLLGVWLGDGSRGGGGITTADPEILEAFVDAGFALGATQRPAGNASTSTTILGLSTILRSLGVREAKHVPAAYLRGSPAQRLALLQGLMDTDGSTSASGCATFSNTNRRIADAAFEIIVSLGWKVRMIERRARLNGRDCGPVWTLKWTPSEFVFRLERKRSRQTLATRRTTRFRYVVDAEECEPSPMRCLTVDSPSGLFLAGRSMLVTHNTKSSLMFGIRCLARYPGLRALLLRETYDELDENVYPELRAIDYAEQIGGHWNAGRRQLDLGRSAMRFRYMGDLDDVLRRRGGSYQLLLLDERNQLPPGTADALRDRLRSADPDVPVIGTRSTANPGGRSHGELKSSYVKPDVNENDVTVDEHGDTRVVVKLPPPSEETYTRLFIPAKASDNPYLGADYETVVLAGIADPVLRAAMKDGDWDVFAGQFFGEWRDARHVVPRNAVELSKSWPRFEGIDYGRAAPFCMLRGALDGDRRLWLHSEIYKAGLGETEQADAIRADEHAFGEGRVYRFGDPSMWGKISDADPIAETYRKRGVRMEPANNDRVSGWARVHTYLAEIEPCVYHARLGWKTCPRLHVLEGTCPNLVRTLPSLPFDRHKVEDLDTDAEDHAADALRYLVMAARPRRSSRPTGQAQRDASASSV